jgi:hypothetical protein
VLAARRALAWSRTPARPGEQDTPLTERQAAVERAFVRSVLVRAVAISVLERRVPAMSAGPIGTRLAWATHTPYTSLLHRWAAEIDIDR